MTEVIYYVAMSVDGFIATPDGGVDWLTPFETPHEDYGYSEFCDSIDALLMGRRTFEQVLSFDNWPYEGKPTWVLSKRFQGASRSEITVTDKRPYVLLAELDELGIQRSWLVGGASLAASFRSEGLISEYIVSIIPVILGGGIPLLDPGGPREHLELVDCKRYENGLMQLHYHRSNDA